MRTKHADRDRDAVPEQADREGGDALISVMMSKRMPSGFTELQEMPRRPGYAEGGEGDAESGVVQGCRRSIARQRQV